MRRSIFEANSKSRLGLLSAVSLAALTFSLAMILPASASAGRLTTASNKPIAPPATKLLSASLLSPTAAWAYYGTGTTHTLGISVGDLTSSTTVQASSPELWAMSQSLLGKAGDTNAYVRNVFDYVRNNVNTEFRYGLSKGGRGALIDQSGTPYDQAELMVSLLRLRGVTANYVVGEVTLSAAQFGQWTGLVNTLNDNAQTFAVDAKAACQMLADGGIPATVNGASDCSTVSGNLSSVTMSHIWVQVAGVNYDPSYKAYTLRNGIDVPAAMGCGTQSASTCGNAVRTAGMSGATSGSQSGIPYVDNYNVLSAKTANNTQKTNLATYIQTQNINGQGINASVYDVLGGKDLSPQTVGTSPLSYAAKYTWTGNIPDQFRTKLSVVDGSCGAFFADEIAGRGLVVRTGIDNVYTVSFLIDGVSTANLSYQAAASCSGTAIYVMVSVDHPYAANSGSYADEATNFKPVDPPADEVGSPYRSSRSAYLSYEGGQDVTPQTYSPSNGTYATDYPEQNYLSFGPMTIIHGFGQAGPSAQKSMSDRVSVKGDNGDQCDITTSTEVQYRDCHYNEHTVVAETFASLRTLADGLVDGVGKTVTTRHHDIGVIYGGRMQGLAMMTLQESLSVAPKSGSSQDRQSAFDMHSLMLAETEARSNAIDGGEGLSAASEFFYGHMVPLAKAGYTPPMRRIYDVASSQMATYLAGIPTKASVTNSDGSVTYGYFCINYIDRYGTALTTDSYGQPLTSTTGCWRHKGLQDVANQGFSTLIMQGGEGELFYNGNSQRAFTMWEYAKGGTTVGDALSTAMKSTDIVDEASKRKKYLSVSPSSGNLTYVAHSDIVTGTGDFPYSLPFIRTFTPTYYETTRGTSTYYYIPGVQGTQQTGSSAAVNSGPDSQYHDRLGGGWMHNYQVMQVRSTDLSYELGSENAYFASELIANLQDIKDLGVSSGTDLGSKITSLFAIANVARTVGSSDFNTIMIRTGSSSISFHNGINGFLASAAPSAKIVFASAGKSTYTSADGQVMTFSPYRYDGVSVYSTDALPTQATLDSSSGGVKLFKADTWSFPDGVQLTFNYTTTYLSDLASCGSGLGGIPYSAQVGYLLSSVTNNLGHSLSFAYVQKWIRQTSTIRYGCIAGAPANIFTAYYRSYALTSVSDDAGHTVTFDNAGSTRPSIFKVTDALQHTTQYDYTGAGSGLTVRNPYQLADWYTAQDTVHPFQKISYDLMSRVSTVTDRNNHVLSVYPGGLFDTEAWKRSESSDGLNNTSVSIFDEKNNNIVSTTPMGRSTTKTYDNSGHVLKTVLPEGNGTQNTYDVRGNVTSVRKFSKTCGSAAASCTDDIVTSTAYMEGPTVLSCVNVVTCDKPSSETDALNNVTDYAWNTSTGQLTQVKLPADRTGKRPQTDVGYTSFSGISLMTSKTEHVSEVGSTIKTVQTTYGYDTAANHYTLKTATADNGGLNLTTTLGYDAVGNLISVDGPMPGAGDTTTYQWDAGRRITAVISPDPDGAGSILRKMVRYTYNNDDLVTQTDTGTATGSDGSGFSIKSSEAVTYDGMGNKTEVRATTTP